MRIHARALSIVASKSWTPAFLRLPSIAMPITRAVAAFASRRRTRAPSAAVESSGASAELAVNAAPDAARAATEGARLLALRLNPPNGQKALQALEMFPEQTLRFDKVTFAATRALGRPTPRCRFRLRDMARGADGPR